MQSVSIENFIKAIYQLTVNSSKRVKTSELSNKLEISNAAISEMAKKLASKKLIDYEKYNGIILAKEGEKLALKIIRKHRLWETFLHDKLKLAKNEIHLHAEELEHVTSDFLADKLDDYLGKPKRDPHGTPIPDSQGNFYYDDTIITLDNAEKGKKYKIVRLSVTNADFLEFYHDNKIENGTILSVLKFYPNIQMVNIEFENSKLMIHYNIANNIFITNV